MADDEVNRLRADIFGDDDDEDIQLPAGQITGDDVQDTQCVVLFHFAL